MQNNRIKVLGCENVSEGIYILSEYWIIVSVINLWLPFQKTEFKSNAYLSEKNNCEKKNKKVFSLKAWYCSKKRCLIMKLFFI
jgi:hypothetical protein